MSCSKICSKRNILWDYVPPIKSTNGEDPLMFFKFKLLWDEGMHTCDISVFSSYANLSELSECLLTMWRSRREVFLMHIWETSGKKDGKHPTRYEVADTSIWSAPRRLIAQGTSQPCLMHKGCLTKTGFSSYLFVPCSIYTYYNPGTTKDTLKEKKN